MLACDSAHSSTSYPAGCCRPQLEKQPQGTVRAWTGYRWQWDHLYLIALLINQPILQLGMQKRMLSKLLLFVPSLFGGKYLFSLILTCELPSMAPCAEV
jgi:hypothetical protein